MPNFDKLINDFICRINRSNIITQDYNEEAIRNELGAFLKKELEATDPGKYLVQYERNVGYFKKLKIKTHNNDFIKKEMDIVVFENDIDITKLREKIPICAVELKFIRQNTDNFNITATPPDNLYHYLQDIQFSEELKFAGVENTYAILFSNHKSIYSNPGRKITTYKNLYNIFRDVFDGTKILKKVKLDPTTILKDINDELKSNGKKDV